MVIRVGRASILNLPGETSVIGDLAEISCSTIINQRTPLGGVQEGGGSRMIGGTSQMIL
jgi:hypothetical protein